MQEIYFKINHQIRQHCFGLIMISILIFSCRNPVKTTAISYQDTIPVKVVALAQEHSNEPIHTSGTFTTDDEVILSFKNGGIIDHIYVHEGDQVVKGQLLATVKKTEVNAGAQQAALAYEKADRDYQRAVNLYKDSVATLEQVQNAKTAVDIAKQQVTMIGFNQNASEIRATASGYVLQRFAVEGQTAGPGVPVFRINGATKGNWFLKVGVNEKQLNMISMGDSALLNSDAFPAQALTGTVDKKSKGIDPSSGTFNVYIKICGQKIPAIVYGMFAKAVITPAISNSNWKISYNALLDGQEGSGYVFITNDGKKAQKVPVVINSISKDGVLISSGLENAKYLIASGGAYLNDGSNITITNE